MESADWLSLNENEELLEKAGWHRLSPWWLDVLRVAIGKHNVVIRVGRRGGKSSAMCRLAMAVVRSALKGRAHRVGNGDVGQIVIVSASTSQARERIQMIARGLDACGIPYKQRYETLDVADGSGETIIRVAAVAATLSAVVSKTVVLAIADEVARWRTDKGENPAAEVLGSLRGSLEPDAGCWLISSPWSESDEHAQQFDAADEDDDADPIRFYAPTWVARPQPEWSEAETRRREPDAATWEREYKAIPMGGGESVFFDRASVEAAFGVAI